MLYIHESYVLSISESCSLVVDICVIIIDWRL